MPRIPVRVNVLNRAFLRASTQTEASIIPKIFPYASVPHLLPQSLHLRYRAFSDTPLLFKKKGRADREKEEEESDKSSGVVEDPFDFSTLESGIEKTLEKLNVDLSKLRTGGRFNPEVLESLRVQLGKNAKTTERLGDLAQVLPKGGRNCMVLVGEKDHVKPIISAIQGSQDLNLQPQPDAHNELQLNIPIPPPTKESRDLALAAATKAGETANVGVRNARGAMQKRLRAMELKKAVRPDDLKKAQKEMEKVVEKGGADIKKIVDTARKSMEQT